MTGSDGNFREAPENRSCVERVRMCMDITPPLLVLDTFFSAAVIQASLRFEKKTSFVPWTQDSFPGFPLGSPLPRRCRRHPHSTVTTAGASSSRLFVSSRPPAKELVVVLPSSDRVVVGVGGIEDNSDGTVNSSTGELPVGDAGGTEPLHGHPA
ncbi:hypothetical protein DFH07DRAFT_769619 [Mycena maculata]|uniref:Uncharacterized protein n=1 Tax=Mycena maculata TaxID=230809 RepID=A0AAD7JLQ1_9AGAR|nr:hypothetical protein DFH07DRAFT_769619 [Mycena maculata]